MPAQPRSSRRSTKPPLARSVGGFFGELWKAVTHDPAPASKRSTAPASTRNPRNAEEREATDPRVRVVDQRVEEKVIDTPHGPMTLRRTTIDEVEYPEQR
ncbi:MAG: hypothetical protein SFY96_13440 [Planctomycetota bacterium]|nr:hypothetical protein [Planctomycetota bacterium]